MTEVLNVRKWKSSGPYPSLIVTTSSYNLNIQHSLRVDDSLCMQIDKLTRSLLREENQENQERTCEFYEFASIRTYGTNERFERARGRVFASFRTKNQRNALSIESFKRTRPYDERSKQLSRVIKSCDEFSSPQGRTTRLRRSVTTSFQVIQSVYENCTESFTSCIASYQELVQSSSPYCNVYELLDRVYQVHSVDSVGYKLW